MRKSLWLVLLVLVALGAGLGPFHHHLNDRDCGICKVTTAAGHAPDVISAAGGPVCIPASFSMPARLAPEFSRLSPAPARAPPASGLTAAL